MTQLHKKNIVIAFLLLVLIALGASIVWFHQQDLRKFGARTLLPQTAANNLVIERNNEQLVFTKQNEDWHMQQPAQGVANMQRIVPILSLLTLPQSHRYALAEVNTQELGLSPAQAVVTINNLAFHFGLTDDTGKRRYLQINDGVYLVDDLVFPLINSTTDSFLQKN